jgi:hypothetical protein
MPLLVAWQYGHGRALRIAFSSLPHQEYTLDTATDIFSTTEFALANWI